MQVTETKIDQPAPPLTSLVIVVMSLAIVALSFSSIFITKLEQASVPPLAIAFYRMALASMLLLPTALALRRGELAAFGRREVILLLLAAVCLAVHFAAWISSLRYIPIARAVVLVNSHPILVVITSYLVLRERPKLRSVAAIVLGLAGLLIISRDGITDAPVTLKGDALALTGAFAVVGYIILGKQIRQTMSLLGYLAPLYGTTAVLLLIGIVLARQPIHPYSSSAWLYLAGLALIPTIFGHGAFNWAVKHVSPSVVSVGFLGEPLVASLLAFFFFGQAPRASTLVGGALILLGIYLVTSAPTENRAPNA